MTFKGILAPMVDSLSRQNLPQNKLSGKEIVMSNKGTTAFIAVDSENDTHLLLYPSPADDKRFERFNLTGLKVSIREWVVADQPVKKYLDVTCSTGSLPNFKRPFMHFAEDVLYELEQGGSPEEGLYITCVRWRRFWSPDKNSEVTREWVYGLFGELSFLIYTTQAYGSKVVNHWAGAYGDDHDFQVGDDLGIEVKTSSDVPFRIHCNIRQLDHSLFKHLFLVCYQLTADEKGQTLLDLVRTIEGLLKDDEQSLDKFYDALASVGYERALESRYAEFQLTAGNPNAFKVDDDFPKIIADSFAKALDERISNIRYVLEMSGLQPVHLADIQKELEFLRKGA